MPSEKEKISDYLLKKNTVLRAYYYVEIVCLWVSQGRKQIRVVCLKYKVWRYILLLTDDSRKWFTVFICTCASRLWMPMVIFKTPCALLS